MPMIKLEFKGRTIELSENDFDIVWDALSALRSDGYFADEADALQAKLYVLFKE